MNIEIKDIKTSVVRKSGEGGYVSVNKKYIGKEAIILIPKDDFKLTKLEMQLLKKILKERIEKNKSNPFK